MEDEEENGSVGEVEIARPSLAPYNKFMVATEVKLAQHPFPPFRKSGHPDNLIPDLLSKRSRKNWGTIEITSIF
jgi:hypothetical protein